MAVTDQFRQDVLEVLDEQGYNSENEQDVIEDVSELDDNVTLPGIKRDAQGTLTGYCMMRLSILVTYLSNRFETLAATFTTAWNSLRDAVVSATDAANAAAGSVNSALTQAASDHTRAEEDHTRAEGDHTTASSDHGTAQSDHNTATSDHTTASSDHSTAQSDHTTATSDHTTAASDHTKAVNDHDTAVSDHNTAASDHTASESATNAANAAAGSVSDALEQAASDHNTAVSDHNTATSDHSTASSDHTRAESDHTSSVTATTGAENVNATLSGTTITVTDRNGNSTSANVKGDKGDPMTYEDLTPEQKAELVSQTADVTYDASTHYLKKTKAGTTTNVVQVYTKEEIDAKRAPNYDEETETITFPATAAFSYDSTNETIILSV